MSLLTRRPALIAAAAVAAVLLAGCSSGSATSESTVEAPNASAVQTLPTSEAAPTQGAQQGGEQGEDGEGEDGEGEEGEEGGQVAAPSGAGTSASYTLADVSAHATPEDCWSAVDGGVFDLTSWIPQHPGGSEVIVGMCGVDGSAAFDSVHGGQGEPAQVLAQLQVGVLAG